MKAAGLSTKHVRQFDKDSVKIARFFVIEDPDGYKIEVLERSGHFA
jgi:lactoylglutathione lyase